MRYIKCLIFIFITITSCQLNKNISTISFGIESHTKFLLKIPSGYKTTYYQVTIEREARYMYNDSSYIYISNFHYSPNFENIRNLGDSIFEYRFRNDNLIQEVNQLLGKTEVKPKRFELSGQNQKLLYWKDIQINNVSIGYVNVPIEQKELFDKSIESLKIKRY